MSQNGAMTADGAFANVLKSATESLQAVLMVAAGMNGLAFILAVGALLPMRHRHQRMVAAPG